MRPLDMLHSRQLFYRRLFNSEEACPSHLKEISSQILEKCAGLPLAIIAISGLLADKASKKDTWERVKDSVGRALRNASDDVMVNIISLSYLDLPRHLKTCLLYLSIFPEDHTIEKDNLMRWIGEGFIHEQVGYTLHESGEMCFNELLNRSLIQPEVHMAFGEVKCCRVHDTVLDFIVSKDLKENFVTIVGVGVNPDSRNKVRRLSLQNGGEIPAGLVISSARSLHVFGRNAKMPSLSEFRLLRVLDYEDCSQLEDGHLSGIGNLLHLKYLRFKDARALRKLPEQVARLPHLEIDICDNVITEIPETIWQLKWLDICDETVPDDYLAAMQGLQVLDGLYVYKQSIEFLARLGQLKNLRRLTIKFNNINESVDMSDLDMEDFADFDNLVDQDFDGITDTLEQFVVMLGNAFHKNTPSRTKTVKMVSSIAELSKSGLESLEVYIEGATDQAVDQMDWFPKSDHPSPYGLQELVLVSEFGFSRFPTWMASLINLEKLCISIWGVGKEDMEILGGLPNLRHLNIVISWNHDEDGIFEFAAIIKRMMEVHPNRPSCIFSKRG